MLASVFSWLLYAIAKALMLLYRWTLQCFVDSENQFVEINEEDEELRDVQIEGRYVANNDPRFAVLSENRDVIFEIAKYLNAADLVLRFQYVSSDWQSVFQEVFSEYHQAAVAQVISAGASYRRTTLQDLAYDAPACSTTYFSKRLSKPRFPFDDDDPTTLFPIPKASLRRWISNRETKEERDAFYASLGTPRCASLSLNKSLIVLLKLLRSSCNADSTPLTLQQVCEYALSLHDPDVLLMRYANRFSFSGPEKLLQSLDSLLKPEQRLFQDSRDSHVSIRDLRHFDQITAYKATRFVKVRLIIGELPDHCRDVCDVLYPIRIRWQDPKYSDRVFLISGVSIGPWYYEWGANSLCVPKRCYDHANMTILQSLSLGWFHTDVCVDRAAEVVAHWNATKRFSWTKNNSQQFVDELLAAIGIEINARSYLQTYLQYLRVFGVGEPTLRLPESCAHIALQWRHPLVMPPNPPNPVCTPQTPPMTAVTRSESVPVLLSTLPQTQSNNGSTSAAVRYPFRVRSDYGMRGDLNRICAAHGLPQPPQIDPKLCAYYFGMRSDDSEKIGEYYQRLNKLLPNVEILFENHYQLDQFVEHLLDWRRGGDPLFESNNPAEWALVNFYENIFCLRFLNEDNEAIRNNSTPHDECKHLPQYTGGLQFRRGWFFKD